MANCNPILPRSHINLLLLLLLFVKGRLIDIQFLLSSAWLCNKVPDIQQIPPGTPGNSWWGCAARFSKSWPYVKPKKFHSPHPFSDLASKIHTSFSDLEVVIKRNITCLHKTEIMSSSLTLKPQRKDFLKSISNSHITLSFLFIWNWNDEHIDTQP